VDYLWLATTPFSLRWAGLWGLIFLVKSYSEEVSRLFRQNRNPPKPPPPASVHPRPFTNLHPVSSHPTPPPFSPVRCCLTPSLRAPLDNLPWGPPHPLPPFSPPAATQIPPQPTGLLFFPLTKFPVPLSTRPVWFLFPPLTARS